MLKQRLLSHVAMMVEAPSTHQRLILAAVVCVENMYWGMQAFEGRPWLSPVLHSSKLSHGRLPALKSLACMVKTKP